MVELSLKKLTIAIEKGKVRGFDEIRKINGINYFFQYALKKQGEKYSTYLFSVPEEKIELIEDYATEEINIFSNIEDAFNYFKLQGVDIVRFSSIRGGVPF
ncbi:TPA: hypothetical protein OTT09_004514 [Enterobacter asburiae]|jgi:hypothetical protein|uniref:hypothetical protein n=1 Tax=Enterobacter TaxID=547 RepID=UPI00135C5B4F|nr:MULTISPECIES: hypothetical protein [Enterobacter]HCT3173122.1 hypothetical protein [Enterobacter asburiae]